MPIRKGLYLSVVIPAYNEADRIESTLESLNEYLRRADLGGKTEVIVVSADSPDFTKDIAKRVLPKLFPRWQHITPGKRVGKGRDVRLGLRAAGGQRIVYFDADLATPLRHIQPALELIDKGADVVIGYRDLKHIHQSAVQRMLSVYANKLVRMTVLPGIRDTQCGFKAFTDKAVGEMIDTSIIDGWGFDIEFLTIARKKHLTIKQMPIPDWRDPKPRRQGLSGDNQSIAALQTLNELLRIKYRELRGKYG